jgi:hypothetical protein
MTPYFHDVADHVHRVQSMVDGLLVLSTVFEASSLQRKGSVGHSPARGLGGDLRSRRRSPEYMA